MLAAMTDSDQDQKARSAAKLFSKLQARERLKHLADNPEPKTREESELERLRAYLRMWSERQRDAYKAAGGADSCLAYYMKSQSPEASELLEQSDGWAMTVIDASVDDLTGVGADGGMMRAALRVRWLNEGLAPGSEIKIRVFRSGRLQALSLIEADALADRAEVALVPIVKRRGLPL